jgi:hypothetical protein
MTTKNTPASSKEQVLAAFNLVLNQQKALASRIATKEEEAERANERKLVQTASSYSVESIVKGLADLQLFFGDDVEKLSTRLVEESARLDSLRKAIHIETGYVKGLNDLKVAADALNILNQEHRESLRVFEESVRLRREALESEVNRARTNWADEQRQFELMQKEQAERLASNRKQAEADSAYELERKRKLAGDAFSEKQRKLERDIAEAELAKNKQWQEREKLLAASQAEYEQKKARLDAFPAELEAEVKKAREEAIREAANDAKIKAELMEKEIEANRKVFALQTVTLEETIKKQSEQIEALNAQLQAALKQSQDLALKAIEGAAATHRKAEAQA